MKPVIKYQGGKSKELPLIKEMLPKGFNRVVEPFCGGAAVAFGLGYPALLSDINPMVINLYKVLQSDDYVDVLNGINEIKTLDHDALQEEYYAARDVINGPDGHTSVVQAISYIVVRQLCFSGMERYNSDGKFNVPYGHYKRLSCNLTPDHHRFLKNCDVRFASFDETLSSVNDDDFVFIDPPYLDRLGYTKGDGGFELHSKLHSILSEVKAPWMIIHSDHEFYREYYKDFNITDKNFAYAQRFGKEKKDSRIVGETLNVFELIGESDEIEMERPLERDHSGAKVGHLYITNY
jgi:DNA adenine methylase